MRPCLTVASAVALCLWLLLGDITKIKVEHDNSGLSPGWLLERVEITNTASNRKWTFACSTWLDKRKGDGEIAREFYPRE